MFLSKKRAPRRRPGGGRRGRGGGYPPTTHRPGGGRRRRGGGYPPPRAGGRPGMWGGEGVRSWRFLRHSIINEKTMTYQKIRQS